MITLSISGGDSIQIDFPEYNYTTTSHLAISITKTMAGYKIWDNGISNDYRTCSIDRFYIDSTQSKSIDDFILANRGENINLVLPEGSGFFPFAPDKGDYGTFVVKIIDRKFGQFDQFSRYSKSLELLLVTPPSYEFPEISQQGSFQIGSVDGLLYPQLGIDVETQYGIGTGISYGGDAYSVDIKRNVYTAEFTQQCNTSLASYLMAFITGATGRDSDITVVAPTNYYLFGIQNGSSGTYTCKITQSVIECKHVGNEQFEIKIPLWMKAVA